MISPMTNTLRWAWTLNPPGQLSKATDSEHGLYTLCGICSHKYYYASFTDLTPRKMPQFAWQSEGPLSVREVSCLNNKAHYYLILKAPGRAEALPNSSSAQMGLVPQIDMTETPLLAESLLVDLHTSVPKSLELSNTFAYANTCVNLLICVQANKPDRFTDVTSCRGLHLDPGGHPSVVQFSQGLPLFRLEAS